MKRLLTLVAFLFGLLVAPVAAQQVVRIFGTQSGGTITAALVDSTGRLLVSLAGGAITPTSVTVDQSCTAPGYNFASATTSGYGLASSTACVVIGGTQKLGVSTSAVTLASGVTFDLGNSTSMSQGSANRIDIASGDSLYLVSGGLGVGVTPPAAGSIQASGGLTAGGNQQINFLARAFLTSPADGKLSMATNDTTSGILIEQFTNNPTCATNCGTSPTLNGVDSSFTLIMGAAGSPASGFVVTFNGTWPAAPQCTVSMGLAGMVVGKLPLTVATTTTTATVVTNGTAPANSDIYHFRCSSGQ